MWYLADTGHSDILLANPNVHPSARLHELTGLRPFTMAEREHRHTRQLMLWFEIYSGYSQS